MTKLEIFLTSYLVLSNILMVLFVHTSRKKTWLLTIYAIMGFPLTTIILSIQELIERKKDKKMDKTMKARIVTGLIK